MQTLCHSHLNTMEYGINVILQHNILHNTVNVRKLRYLQLYIHHTLSQCTLLRLHHPIAHREPLSTHIVIVELRLLIGGLTKRHGLFHLSLLHITIHYVVERGSDRTKPYARAWGIGSRLLYCLAYHISTGTKNVWSISGIVS